MKIMQILPSGTASCANQSITISYLFHKRRPFHKKFLDEGIWYWEISVEDYKVMGSNVWVLIVGRCNFPKEKVNFPGTAPLLRKKCIDCIGDCYCITSQQPLKVTSCSNNETWELGSFGKGDTIGVLFRANNMNTAKVRKKISGNLWT